MNICETAANASTRFEQTNTEQKREYLIRNINIINTIMSVVPGYCGSFGTGYPFYALDPNLRGELPVISEQLRYNRELLNESKKTGATDWVCARCLLTNGHNMPDLKQICKPCPKIADSLKPRKVINRLPDIDMWMICLDEYIEEAKERLVKIFNTFDMHTSDVNPVKTIYDIDEISKELESGKMPRKLLPLDVHIIPYSEFSKLLSEIPFVIDSCRTTDEKPYIAIHPISLRKTWQYDDEAYNFVLDYLYSLTPFNWSKELSEKLKFTRRLISQMCTEEELKDLLSRTSSDSVKRRFENQTLVKTYEGRVESWRK